MKNLKLLTILFVIACLLCGCSSKGNTGPAIELNDEDKELLEILGTDIHVIAPGDFTSAVSALTAENAGELFQITGYFQAAAEGEENPSLGDAKTNPKTTLSIRYLNVELTPGDQYTITGALSAETHEDHAHITLDVMTVETYTGN